MQAKVEHVEQLRSNAAQQEASHSAKLAQQAAAAEAATAELEQQLAAAKQQTSGSQQQADSLQSQLAKSQTQLQSVQQQNNRLLTDVVAAQREAAEVAKQKKQALAELGQLQQQVSQASGDKRQVQYDLQAVQAEHARLVTQFRCVPLATLQPPLNLSSVHMFLSCCTVSCITVVSGLAYCQFRVCAIDASCADSELCLHSCMYLVMVWCKEPHRQPCHRFPPLPMSLLLILFMPVACKPKEILFWAAYLTAFLQCLIS